MSASERWVSDGGGRNAEGAEPFLNNLCKALTTGMID